VLKWQKEKWIDYVIPQIYWHRGFKLADFNTLAKWWNENSFGVQVYVGQGLYRVNGESSTEAWKNPNEIPEQIDIIRSLPNLQGICLFSSKSLISNPQGVSDILREQYFTYPALIPKMNWLENTALSAPEIDFVHHTNSGIIMEWNGNPGDEFFVIYKFRGKRIGDLNDPSNVVAIKRKTSPYYKDVQLKRFRKYTYAISSLDRLYNESELSIPVITSWKKPKKK